MSSHRTDRTNDDFEVDPRYKVANKEALIALAFWVGQTAAITIIAIAIGYGKSPGELSFILGIPSWFFWTGGITTLVFCIIPYILVKLFFKDISLEATDSHQTDKAVDND
ncbi:DUF997 family protein [Spelaeicoccus albus]|uniref:Putative membrane protein YhdT n=1 Tax=Spelaeicoccus albus TaxID=1280376 RepID=A0A7Z0D4P3_9MICO|nr:YhdT family protein [Spelaeicoccus albus]NYI68814.1 putative membrane protein YhdT [Spelaeicoccus albus]